MGKHTWNVDELEEGQQFIGQIEEVEWADGNFGEQLHVAIRPKDHEVKGATGCYHEWFSFSTKKNSKWGAWLGALKECGVTVKDDSEMEKLKGKTFVWQSKTIRFGEDKDGKVIEAKDLRLPVSAVDASGKPTGMKKTEMVTAKAVASPAKPIDFTELDGKLKEDGFTQGQIYKWAERKGVLKAEVNAYMEGLQKAGRLEEKDGVFVLKA